MDFSATSAWERSGSALNTYQNGAYWHTASGWLIEQLWKEDRKLALDVFSEMIAHLRDQVGVVLRVGFEPEEPVALAEAVAFFQQASNS
jgi:hypothetical protein